MIGSNSRPWASLLAVVYNLHVNTEFQNILNVTEPIMLLTD